MKSRNFQIAVRSFAFMALVLITTFAVREVIIRGIGRPAPTGFTSCPTAFFISSFIMIATGASLGLSIHSPTPQVLRTRLRICLLCGSTFLGVQSYGLWCLAMEKPVEANQFLMVASILGTAHFLCCLAVVLLISFGYARMINDEETANRCMLKVCAGFWYLLGFTWTFLLCSFAALL